MHAGQKRLGGRHGPFEALDDLGEGVADLRLLVELVLEEGEDGGVEERLLGRHGRHWAADGVGEEGFLVMVGG